MSNKMAEAMVKDINKKFGEGNAYMAADVPRRGGVSSGSLALDYAIGPMGGFPRDRVMEIFGPESSGKTTLGLLAVSNFLDAQPKRGALILDTEHKLTKERLTQMLGPVRMERVVVTYPDYVEAAQDIYTELVPTGDISVVLFDSIGGSPNKTMTERGAEEVDYGNAKAVTRFGKIASGMSHKYESLIMGINQLRDNMNPNDHSLNTPGGKGWKYNSMLRIYLRKGKGKMSVQVGNDTVVVGNTVAGRIYKNHLGGIEGREFSYWFYNTAYKTKAIGVDRGEETSRLSVATGVVARSGGWLSHPAIPGGKIQGQPNLTELMDTNEEVRKIIAEATLDALRAAGDGEAAVDIAPQEMAAEEDPQPQLGRNPLREGL